VVMPPSPPSSLPTPRRSRPQKPRKRTCSVDSAHHNRQGRQTVNRSKRGCSVLSLKQALECFLSRLSRRTTTQVVYSGHKRTSRQHRRPHRQSRPPELRLPNSLRIRKSPTPLLNSQLLLEVPRALLVVPLSLPKNKHRLLLRQQCRLSRGQLHRFQQTQLNCQKCRKSVFRKNGLSQTLRTVKVRTGCT
jgi:hypothetical protein